MTIQQVHIKAQANKRRSIYLLEWAIMAPLSDLKPKPTLDEIKQELGISQIEFLVKTADDLKALGVIEQINHNEYELTESGKKLYHLKQMISDSREVVFSIYREPLSSEWFFGIDRIQHVESQDINYENANTPDYIPDIIVKNHVKEVKRLLQPQEEILTHEIDEVEELNVNLGINLYLTREGLDVRVISHPFGGKYTKKIQNIIFDQLIREGKLKPHIDRYLTNSIYQSQESIQIHRLTEEMQLFLPNNMKDIFTTLLTPQKNWLITNITQNLEFLPKYVKKPKITIFIGNSNNLSARKIPNNLENIFPTNIELFIDSTDFMIPSNSVISSEQIVILTNIETNNYSIPLFIQRTDKNTQIERELLIKKIIMSLDESSFERNLALYYLQPTLEGLRAITVAIHESRIQSVENAKYIQEEVIKLQRSLTTDIKDLNLSEGLLKRIMSFYNRNELINIELNEIFLNTNAYLSRLDQLLLEQLEYANENDWDDFQVRIDSTLKNYQDLKIIQLKLISKQDKKAIKKLQEAIKQRLQNCQDFARKLIPQLLNLSNVREIEIVFENIKKLETENLSLNYLMKIKELFSSKESIFSALDILELQAFLSKHNLSPSNKDLKHYVNQALLDIEINLSDKRGLVSLNQIITNVSKIDKNFRIDKVLIPLLSKSKIILESKDQIRNLVSNLKDLHTNLESKIDDFIKKYLRVVDKVLRPSSYKELEIWLLFLERIQSILERPLGTKVIQINSNKIWKITLPYLEEDFNREKELRNLLGSLKAGSELKKWRKNQKKNQMDENHNNSSITIQPPPISRIVVDGNNVVKMEKEGEKYSVKKLIQLYEELKTKYQFVDIVIFISAALKYAVHDFQNLEFLISSNVVRETPAGVSDDYFIIQQAIKDDTLILTNDLFRDWKEKYPKLKKDIIKRRVTFMIDPKTKEFILGEYQLDKEES